MQTATVIHLPRPQTRDAETIFCARLRALKQYSAARTDGERFTALIWVNHWRCLDGHAKVLRDRLGQPQ